MRLIADVGGTNSRLALSQAGAIRPGTAHRFTNADWNSLYDVIGAFLKRHETARPAEMVIAVAGPVHGDQARLTNRGWPIETAQLTDVFGSGQVHLLNDLTALGYSVPLLRSDQLGTVSAGATKQTGLAQSLVVGIGTGFNVSPVLENAGLVLCPAAEAGHVAMPATVIDGLAVSGIPATRFPTVETLFSGRGFAAFCQELTDDPALQGASAITAYGVDGSEQVTATVNRYSALLGLLLRELSLAYMPASGIYLAGSVARAVVARAPAPCIAAFRRPCAISRTMGVPIWTIEDDGAALAGCAGYVFS